MFDFDDIYFDEPVDPFEDVFESEQPYMNPNNSEEQNSEEQNNLFNRRRRSPKRKVILSEEAEELKSRYYSTFTSKKVFPKEFILQIHRKILSQKLGLPKMTRDERRQKDLYFQKYAFMKKEILECLENNKEIIANTILKDIKMKKAIN